MNTGSFAGYLGRDAEVRTVGDNKVCNFSIAVRTGWGDRESTLWVSCALWGERGDKLSQYLTKGSAVTVSGDVDIRQYDKKDGTAGAEMTCNVQRITLQGGPREEKGTAPYRKDKGDRKTSADVEPQGKPAAAEEDPFGDDIPF